MTAPLLKCVGLAKSFGDFLAVRNVSFEVFPGEIVSILGSSGSGKTTVLRLIAGLEAPTAGEVIIQGEVASTPERQTPPDKRAVGMVVQEYALFPHMTVEQNIAFGLHELDDAEIGERVTEVMELVQLPELGARYPHELSGGQQQRVALARTLAPRPVTVLMDEPFSNVDAGMRSEMRRQVEAILRDGQMAAVFVTHDRDQAFAIADRVGIMSDGEMAQVDTPEAVYHLPVSRHVARLTGACDFLPGEVQADGTAITEAGVFPILSPAEELESGAEVDLLVRPDDFGIEVNESGAALLQSREFRGDETMLVAAMPSGRTLRCRKESFFDLSAGIRVDLVLRRPTPFAAFRS
ncbi:MAG: ABC transporter ATP-binding protein [SAR202 cluster bacterium]|nr:ABC transporter ATP-binding protein [SAR202 cluster bacterium]HAL46273.1 ABC transporter ATP-binding protein [Dehalococcoidia bacterium]MDP6665205.1 ABC transporter ATP-binding protein [SAR202 cluster bacterium]MDP6799302.1 ABC transporter ATP-binding protein [SAR202 cluster bacterium]MQG57234.1 ABC transporter ATP-binding protein [SAR202 cluster bacterium]